MSQRLDYFQCQRLHLKPVKVEIKNKVLTAIYGDGPEDRLFMKEAPEYTGSDILIEGMGYLDIKDDVYNLVWVDRHFLDCQMLIQHGNIAEDAGLT